MIMRLTLLFLLISSTCFGQLTAHQSALFYRSISTIRPPLTFEATTTVIDTLKTQAQGGINQLVGPRLLWENGKTHYVYQDADVTTGARKFILTYDERYGIGRPAVFGVTTIDNHHIPALIRHNNKLYVTAEIEHNDQPIRIWAAPANDELRFIRSATTIGDGPSPQHNTYPNTYIKNGIFSVLSQGNSGGNDALLNKNSSGDFEGTWSSDIKISDRAVTPFVEDAHYVGTPFNSESLSNEFVFSISGRTNDATGFWFNKYLVRAEVTAGGQTFRDWDRSFSTTSTITAGEMATHFQYYTTGDDALQGYVPVSAIDQVGNFYDITGDGAGGYDFIYFLNGQASPTVKTLTLPDSPTILDNADIGGDPQNGGCLFLLAISPNEIYAFMRIDVSGTARCIRYKTVDLGDNWTEEGDVFSDVTENIYRFTIPYNAFNIPDNRNFICIATGLTGSTEENQNIYIKRCAWGEIQDSETENYYDNYTAYTESEYDALMLRSYYIEAGKISNTGTTLTGLTDQSPSAQNATVSGSPVIDDATTPTFGTLDGVNDRYNIPITGLTTLTEGTIIVVAKAATGADRVFLSITRTTFSTPALYYGQSDTDRTNYIDQSFADVEGSTAVTNDWHIFVFTHQDISAGVRHWLDGELQFRTVVTPAVNEGRFTNSITNENVITVGAALRNTNTFYAFDFKHAAIGPALTQEQTARAIKYLANKYSITLTDHFN